MAQAANTSTAKSKAQPAKPIRLRIVVPKPGAHTGQTLTVRVRLTGMPARHAKFRYVLGSVKRRGGSKLTFHGVAPGRHDLTVTLASNRHVRASEVVTVRAPAPPPAPAPVTTSSAPPPTTTSSAPPPTTTSAPPPPPPPTTTSAPPPTTTTNPSGGIPQGGGGDGDADNNGGPSDGDGNI